MVAELDYFGTRPRRIKSTKLLASDALPLPVWLTNRIFLAILSAAVYFFCKRWGVKKARAASLLTFEDIIVFLAIIASLIYMLGFFGIDYVQNFIGKSSDDRWDYNVGIDGVARNCVVQGDCHNMPATKPQVHQLRCQSLSADSNDEDIVDAVSGGVMPLHSLEAMLGDAHRAASIRKRAIEVVSGQSLNGLPLHGFDYTTVLGRCCELVIGHVQIPVGVAGPLMLDGMEFMIPMATTEGCLVASTNRGCKAIHQSGGASSIVLKDGMTRAPVVSFERVQRSAELKLYIEDRNNFETLSAVFNRSSKYARLQCIQCALAGRHLYLRFSCATGDAMGMNMVSKGVHNVLDFLQDDFPDMNIVSLSGNFCTDKKASAVNWINGRGKSVVCDAIIKGDVVTKVLKTTVRDLVELNVVKNLVGSAMAATVGGFNAHASNIVSAIFIATGQDPAQNVESSNCITMMESANDGHDLHVSVTMPSIEVGTVGGGTELASQAACLNLLGVKGANRSSPGENAQKLARVVAGAVLAGELSLMSALAAGHLVKSHMKYNRPSDKEVADVAEVAACGGGTQERSQ